MHLSEVRVFHWEKASNVRQTHAGHKDLGLVICFLLKLIFMISFRLFLRCPSLDLVGCVCVKDWSVNGGASSILIRHISQYRLISALLQFNVHFLCLNGKGWQCAKWQRGADQADTSRMSSVCRVQEAQTRQSSEVFNAAVSQRSGKVVLCYASICSCFPQRYEQQLLIEACFSPQADPSCDMASPLWSARILTANMNVRQQQRG